MVEEGKVEEVEFKWGKKKGRGGKKKEVQFYESFSYDGVEYTLFDCVYLYKEGEPEPYIGKLIKIWEQPDKTDKTKKVKVLWFFRPCEILNYLGVEQPSDNELFLASGDGPGLANVNPLEAIAGKCNVVCTSKDIRNRQPSLKELHMADFVFYRIFDVGTCTILDKIDEKIAGIDVKFILNSASNECAIVNINGSSADTSAKENKLMNDPLGKQNSSPGKEIFSGEVTTLSSKVDPDGNGVKSCKADVSQDDIERKVKSAKDSDGLDSRTSKKVKLDSSVKQFENKNVNTVQKINLDSDDKDLKEKTPPFSASEDNYKHKLPKDSHGTEEGPSKRLNPVSNGKVLTTSSKESPKEQKTDRNVLVTRRPDANRSKWFTGLPWEERMKSAHEQGTLVLLQNLDPMCTSAEVEDIVWHGFSESCTAKMIQQTAVSSPHYGQALIIFKTTEAAEKVVRELDAGCLMLSNGRFLVGSFANPCVQGKRTTFFGHLAIDKLKLQMQREMKQAVSTSHCSQPNTLEYEMAMDWCLLQERSDLSWKKFFKLQGEELRKLKVNLKSK